MAETCAKLGCPRYLRLSLMDRCSGESIPGAANGMVMQCTRNAGITPRVTDPETSTFTSDCGIPDEYTTDAYTQGYDVTFEVANFSPEMDALLSGQTILINDALNVGIIGESASGCQNIAQRPSFLVEAFYEVRTCNSGDAAGFYRFVVPNVRFAPAEIDTEGQIRFRRYNGIGYTAPAEGLVANNPGPFADWPEDIVTQIEGLDAGFVTDHLEFFDPITDPVGDLTLAANTCYTATVPVAAP